MALKLFYAKISPPSRAVHMVIRAIKLKDVEYEEINILSKKYLTQELKEINPQHTVPTLQDGPFVLWDSHAIAAYLVNKYAKTDTLYPRDHHLRGLVDQRLHFDTGVLYPRVHQVIFPILFNEKAGISPSNTVAIRHCYSLMETFLNVDKWIAGYSLTIADLCCLASISTLDYVYPITMEEYPNLEKYMQRCKLLPYYEEANQQGLDILGSLLEEKIQVSIAAKRNKFKKSSVDPVVD